MAELQRFEPALRARAQDRCELCGSEAELEVLEVSGAAPSTDATQDTCVLLCATCRAQIAGDTPLHSNHLRCLQAAAWSEVPAVQVTSFRLLRRLSAEPWAVELLDSLYLDDETRAWAEAGSDSGSDAGGGERPRDSNGVELADGDAVTLIKDLDVKGAGFVAKRGTLVKGIRLTGDPEHVEGRVNKVAIVLKTRFLKKA